jgi:acyl-homoserine lactone acylase PvdQ
MCSQARNQRTCCLPIACCRTSSTPPKLSGNPIALAAAATLAAWDRNADAASKGAVLFEAWWAIVINDLNANTALARDNTINFNFGSPHPEFGKGWMASDPLITPAGLANAAAWVPDLIKAAAQLFAAHYPVDVAWGDVHKIVLATHDTSSSNSQRKGQTQALCLAMGMRRDLFRPT